MKIIFLENVFSIKNLACTALLAATSIEAQAFVCGEPTHGYIVKNSNAYYWWADLSSEDGKRIEKKIPTVDVNTFQELEMPSTPNYLEKECLNPAPFYAKDKDHVYFQAEIVDGADPATFSFFDKNYTKDKSHIFYETKAISDRIETFHRINLNEGGEYATDGENYYYNGITIKGRGIEILPRNNSYARIDNNIFHGGKLVLGADAKSFSVISSGLKIARDKNHVFFDDKYIVGADPKTFELIAGSNGVFKDLRSVYFKGEKVLGLSPSNIRVSEFGFYLLNDHSVYAMLSLDKNSDEIRILNDRDARSFHELQPLLTLDKNGVYYEDKLISGADQFSFHSINSLESEDKKFRYSSGQIYCEFSHDTSDLIPVCKTPFGTQP